MSRVHIGVKGARVGAWVTAAGDDASAENSRFILDSEGDMLVPHQYITGQHEAEFQDEVTSRWVFNTKTITFTALSYVPLVFVNISMPSGPITYYPIGLYCEGLDGDDHDPQQIFYSGGFQVGTDRVILDWSELLNFDHYFYNVAVFKNKLIP